MAGDFASIGEFKNPVRAFAAHTNNFLRRENFYSETPRLHHRTTHQIAATQARWETQIVLDAGTHSCLTAGGFALDDHRVQPFGRAIHSRGQAYQASANNCEIVERSLRAGAQ